MMEGILQMFLARPDSSSSRHFTLAGAMAPVTIAGALVLQNAEALAAIAFAQMVRKGRAPSGYGGFTSNVDMKSGAPAFGTPEYMKAQLIGGQLARRLRHPHRTSNVCAANTVDAQPAILKACLALGRDPGRRQLHPAFGGLASEGGLRCSYEKMMLRHRPPPDGAEFLTPLDRRGRAGPRCHARVGPRRPLFFGAAHTQARYKNAFYAPIISDWRNFETGSSPAPRPPWRAPTASGRNASRLTKKPPMDPAIAERNRRLRHPPHRRRRRPDGFLRRGFEQCPSSLRCIDETRPPLRHGLDARDTSPPLRGVEDTPVTPLSAHPPRPATWG